jgi:plasmid stabilization system protein ParE
MSGYVLHPETFTISTKFRGYIAEDSLDAADRVITEIFQKIRGLVEFPHQGYRRPNLSSLPLRFALVREYVIAYSPDKAPLRVLAVFHGRRSPHVTAAILRGRDYGFPEPSS